jgi:hypothetical protein
MGASTRLILTLRLRVASSNMEDFRMVSTVEKALSGSGNQGLVTMLGFCSTRILFPRATMRELETMFSIRKTRDSLQEYVNYSETLCIFSNHSVLSPCIFSWYSTELFPLHPTRECHYSRIVSQSQGSPAKVVEGWCCDVLQRGSETDLPAAIPIWC